MNLQYTDRIEVGLATEDAELREAATRFASYLENETLAVRLGFEPLSGVEPVELKIGGAAASLPCAW